MKLSRDVRFTLMIKVCLCILLLAAIQIFMFKEEDYSLNDDSMKKSNGAAMKGDLVLTLSKVAALPPNVPVNESCVPESLPKYPSCNGETGLTGKMLTRPRKLVLMILFAFEVDTLEIALKEQMDVLDKIFIVESTVTHKGMPKPLMWERLKFTERFSFVDEKKVVHIVADDHGNTDAAKYEIWYAEQSQTSFGVERVRAWANISGVMQADDIFISGDVDEIMSRQALFKLKWCETTGYPLTGALWMPGGNFARALRSDYPVSDRPHTFGLPTIYSWGQIVDKDNGLGGRLMTKLDARQQNYIRDGIHMTNPAFLPLAIIKELTATEDNFYTGFINIAYLMSMDLTDLDDEQDNLYNMVDKQCWLAHSEPMEKVTDVQAFIPWFLSCNQNRFPYWFGNADSRNKNILESMQDISFSLKHVPQSYWEKSKVKKLFKHSIYPASNSRKAGSAPNELLDCTMYENF